jgi:predicted ester cyclase
LRSAFAEASCSIEALMAEGDMVAERFTFVGTHRDEFPGYAAGRQAHHVKGMAMFRVTYGKIVARWGLRIILV